MDSHITAEQSRVALLQYELLKKEQYISISFDGGSIKSGQSLYTVHATTQDRRVMLLEGQECTEISHTGIWIQGLVLSTGNTKLARTLIVDEIPHILNLPDPEHHLNNTWKEIASLEFFDKIIRVVRVVVKYFKQSNAARAKLRTLRLRYNLGPGLETIGTTRFSTAVWSSASVQQNLQAIRELCSEGVIEFPEYNEYFVNSPECPSLAPYEFEIALSQLVSVGQPLARAIECLEAASTNPADVFLYWIAVTAKVKDVLSTCRIPNEVCQQVRKIVNRRWKEFFVERPTNVHLCALYRHPAPLGLNQTPLEWWKAFEGTSEAGVLAAIALKLFSAAPHSMADERTMSFLTMLNTAQRARQHVDTVVAFTQVAGFQKLGAPRRTRRSARPNPKIRFFDIERLRRGIDEDERDENINYDESDEEIDHPISHKCEKKMEQLLGDNDDGDGVSIPGEGDGSELNLASNEIRELLADSPLPRQQEAKSGGSNAEVEMEESGGTFDLGSWT
ncbi:hypothetical protein EST38_g13918 [Candolleomyces aberdarensis]|uniref:Uncharacterized protein n=1 Tax=Candolleomyces aberdarensis TaxID=2316362 RepID=A0A4Q2CYM3_9AGAR|nr:hypothetical protein EST38_g13918 [Candolleomyces aberdarensis]